MSEEPSRPRSRGGKRRQPRGRSGAEGGGRRRGPRNPSPPAPADGRSVQPPASEEAAADRPEAAAPESDPASQPRSANAAEEGAAPGPGATPDVEPAEPARPPEDAQAAAAEEAEAREGPLQASAAPAEAGAAPSSEPDEPEGAHAVTEEAAPELAAKPSGKPDAKPDAPADAPAAAARPAPVPGADAATEPGKAPVVADEPAEHGLYQRLWATGLLNVGAIARRELSAYFVSPIGYVVAAVLVLPVSFLGYLAPIGQSLPVTMDPIFSLVALLMVFFTPLYTMRLLAEERRNGTLEVLLTSPVRDWELVTGKWLGGFLFYLATIAFTLFYVVLVSVYTPTHFPASILGLHLELPTVDYGRIIAGYVGVAMVGAAWVAIGLFASSLTSNQIISAVLGVGLLLVFQYLFGTLATFLVSPYSDFFYYLNAATHAASFSAGRLVPKDAIYFVTLTVAALFLTTRVIESRKWR